MELLLLTARLALAAVFLLAGIAKLFDRAGAERAIVEFGAPETAAKPLAVLLPLAEIAAAVLLLFTATAWAGAGLATLLLAAFVGGIVYNMARGNAPDCHCFGQIHSEPVGWSVLIRNLILTAIGVFILAAGRRNAGLSAFDWLGALTAGERMQLIFNLLFAGLLVAVVVALRNVLRNQTILQRQIEVLEIAGNETGRRAPEREDLRAPSNGLPVGAIAPDFAAADLDGRVVTLDNLLLRGKPVLLFFVGVNCQPCQLLLPEIEAWQTEMGAKLSIVLASAGKPADNRRKFGANADGKIVVLQKDNEIAEIFQSRWTPGAVLINADGTIGSPLVTGDVEIRRLVERFKPVLHDLNGHAPDSFLLLPENAKLAAQIGKPAPDFAAPTLANGEQFNLRNYLQTARRKTLLVFWRASCPHCRAMTEELRNWERLPRDFDLLLAVTNEPENEIAREFDSTVLLEERGEVQKIFGVEASPSGILLDESGRVVSDLAAGAAAIFALVGHAPKS